MQKEEKDGLETVVNFGSGGGIVRWGSFLWEKGGRTDAEQSQQIKDEIKPASKQAYEECPDAIDNTDHFAVSYYGDTSGWKTGQFDGKKMENATARGIW